MKRVSCFLVLSLSICLFACHNSRNKEEDNSIIKTALGDFSRHSYFIPIKVDSEGSDKYFVIENGLFANYLNKINGYPENVYQDIVRKYLQSNAAFKFGNSELDKFSFLNVDATAITNPPFNQGKDYILRTFFKKQSKYYVINDSGYKHQNEIIYALFYDGVLSKTDDETGALLVPLDTTSAAASSFKGH